MKVKGNKMSIWKTPVQKPKQEELVAWEDINGIHAGRFDTCYNCFCTCANYRADLRKAKKWCSLENLEDLIAQVDKAERLEQAVQYLKRLHIATIEKYNPKEKELAEQTIDYAIEMAIEQQSNN